MGPLLYSTPIVTATYPHFMPNGLLAIILRASSALNSEREVAENEKTKYNLLGNNYH